MWALQGARLVCLDICDDMVVHTSVGGKGREREGEGEEEGRRKDEEREGNEILITNTPQAFGREPCTF